MGLELTENEEKLRIAIAEAYLNMVGSTILYDHGAYLIKILESNASLVYRVLWEHRNRLIEEQSSHWIGDHPKPEKEED